MYDFVKWLNDSYGLMKTHMAHQGIDIESEQAASYYQQAFALTCHDGFTVSIQASRFHYCSPRRNFDRLENDRDFSRVIVDYGIYNNFELGFPSVADELITPYAEDENDLTGTVYAQVPAETIQTLLNNHGGVKGIQTPK